MNNNDKQIQKKIQDAVHSEIERVYTKKEEAIYFILDEMHKFIGLTPPLKEKRKEYYTSPDWYNKAEWTMEQQEMFTKMMVSKIYKDTELRKSLELPKSVRFIDKEIRALMLYCGWKFKEEGVDNE